MKGKRRRNRHQTKKIRFMASMLRAVKPAAATLVEKKPPRRGMAVLSHFQDPFAHSQGHFR